MDRRVRTPTAPALLAALLLSGCGDSRPPRPNVLLITLDTVRVDHLSGYGYERPTSPVLDALALEGAKFEQAYAPIATTGPSHSTLFTALYPLAHRVVKNGLPLSEERTTLAEILQANGYQTAAIISSFVLTERFGYAQGFEHFEDEFTLEGSSVKGTEWEGQRVEGGFDRRADDTSRRAIEWLRHGRDAARPFFLFAHYFDPHSPYDPPAEFRNRFREGGRGSLEDQIARYDEEIAFTDHEIGRLLEAVEELGLSDDTIVVVTSDHGEGLGQHGHLEHGVNVYEEAVRVPLLVRWPGRIEAGSRHGAPVEFVDLAPTLLELAGIAQPPGRIQGRSLAAALLGRGELEEMHPVFLHRRHYKPGMEGRIRVAGEKFGVRLGSWKLVIGPAEETLELFDLESDPREEHNRYGEEPEVVAKLRAILDEWRLTSAQGDESDHEIAEEDRQGLEVLGYTE